MSELLTSSEVVVTNADFNVLLEMLRVFFAIIVFFWSALFGFLFVRMS